MQQEFLSKFTKYIDDFKQEQNFRLPWLYRTIFYLPIGMIIEEIHLYRMHKLNKDWEKYYQSWLATHHSLDL